MNMPYLPVFCTSFGKIAKYTQDELCCLWFDGQSLSAEAGDSQFISLLSWKQI
jgi:hypothetical protein